LPQSGLYPRPRRERLAVTAAGHALSELRELRDAPAAAVWAAGAPDSALDLLAVSSGCDGRVGEFPVRFEDVEAAAAWCGLNGCDGVAVEALEWEPGVGLPGFVATARRPTSETPARQTDELGRDLARATRLASLASLESALEEERLILAAVLDNASDAIVAVDSDCRVVRHNATAVSLLGRADGESGPLSCGEYLGCVGGFSPDVIEDGDGPASGDAALPARANRGGPECPFRQVLTGAAPIIVLDETTIGPADARIPVSATYVRTPVAEVAAIAVFRDLRAGQALDALKSSFVAAVSHELRTPLAIISGYSQSLLDLDLDETARRGFIERIDGTANRMGGLVDQLLDVATLESDRLAVDPRRISLGPLLKSIIDEVAEMPGSLAVSLSVPPDLPPVYADPIRIGQVVANLLDNARKYGTAGSMVTIRVRRENDQAVVTVDNDGPEIVAEEREGVFDRFYRGRDARSSGTPGIGLGLYLSKRLVEAHGGRIRLEERPGGTCVSLNLPLAVEDWTRGGNDRAAAGRSAAAGSVAGRSSESPPVERGTA